MVSKMNLIGLMAITWYLMVGQGHALAICHPIGCPLKRDCIFGYITDLLGCKTCICKSPFCPTLPCNNYCPRGYLYGSNGCRTCLCRPCPRVFCTNACLNGYVFRNGCKTCQCRNGPIDILKVQ